MDKIDKKTVLPKIALGARLKKCRNVITLGFKPNFTDYSAEEIELINSADKIYYPTAFYANMFHIMGKETFPCFTTYHFVQDKIRQTSLFNMLNIAHPRTKVFYGRKQKDEILKSFSFPFIAKRARGSSMGRGVYLINNMQELSEYLLISLSAEPAYIQEYCPHDRDIRAVVIGNEIAVAYWRIAGSEEFRSNISCGGDISFQKIPQKALNLALHTAKVCGWNDVGLDIVEHNGEFLVIEANMKYGRKGFVKAGIDYNLMFETLIATGRI